MREPGRWARRSAVVVTVLASLTPGCGRVADRPWVVEEFDGSTLDLGRWSTCHWWAPDRCTIESNREMQWYLPSQVAVRDGRLVLTAERSNDPDRATSARPFVSGMVTTGPQEQDGRAKLDFTYGRVEVDLELPTGRGLWPAVWMLPSSTDSRPEIDLLETRGSRPDRWSFHLHPADRSRRSRSSAFRRPDLPTGRHTIGLDWRPGRLSWSVDGDTVWSVTGEDVPDEPMYLVINLAVGGTYPGAPDDTTRFPASVVVHRVRIWR